MNEYVNLTLENIDDEHICCAIGDKKHQIGVNSKKEWIKSKLEDGHIFRKLNARGKVFIEYEPKIARFAVNVYAKVWEGVDE